MDVSFRLVDVFTERPFAGNQLCVVPQSPAGLTGEQMQILAKEIGFSETTFVTGSNADRYTVRIFTPGEELPFAGHPTLGTAFTMVSEERVTSPVVQTSPAGEVPVEIDVAAGSGWMRQLPPEFGPEFDDRELLARALRLRVEDLHPELPAQVVSTGLGPLLVPLRDEAVLRGASNDLDATREACERTGGAEIYAFAIRGEGDVVARFFDPTGVIGEDPATGSAVGPLGAYLAQRHLAGMPGGAVVSQGEMVGRPSELHLEVRPDDDDELVVRVGGGVRIVGEGVFRLESSGFARESRQRRRGSARRNQLDRKWNGALRLDEIRRGVGGLAGQELRRRSAEVGEVALQDGRVLSRVGHDGGVTPRLFL